MTTATVPTTEHGETVQLADGRRLGFAQYGAPDGKPVLFFHGVGGSRLERHPDDSIAASLGVRLIIADRPGIGRSDIRRGRTLLDWPDDVLQLADALQLERFAVLGYSCGAAYVLACAYKISDRLSAAGVASILGNGLLGTQATLDMRPSFQQIHRIAQAAPWLLRWFAWRSQRQMRRDPDKFVDAAIAAKSPSDQAVAETPAMRALMLACAKEVYRQGSTGLYADIAASFRRWNFRLKNLPMSVRIWQGAADDPSATELAQGMSRSIPTCQATFYPGEGHMAVFTHWGEILHDLTQS